jgi:uncharacterized protein (UPF0332 family)
MFENSMLAFSMNRVYYAMFYAVQALLVSRKVSFSKHGQVKAYFNREMIKTGIFPTEMGRLYNKAFEYRRNTWKKRWVSLGTSMNIFDWKTPLSKSGKSKHNRELSPLFSVP